MHLGMRDSAPSALHYCTDALRICPVREWVPRPRLLILKVSMKTQRAGHDVGRLPGMHHHSLTSTHLYFSNWVSCKCNVPEIHARRAFSYSLFLPPWFDWMYHWTSPYPSPKSHSDSSSRLVISGPRLNLNSPWFLDEKHKQEICCDSIWNHELAKLI